MGLQDQPRYMLQHITDGADDEMGQLWVCVVAGLVSPAALLHSQHQGKLSSSVPESSPCVREFWLAWVMVEGLHGQG